MTEPLTPPVPELALPGFPSRASGRAHPDRRGEIVDPARYYFRVQMPFETARAASPDREALTKYQEACY